MAIIWVQVQAAPYAPNDAAIQATSDSDGAAYIAAALLEIVGDCWGDLKDPATAWLAAHKAKNASTDGGSSSASGPVTSQSVGSVSKSYASGSVNYSTAEDSDLASTQFGRNFLRLRALACPEGFMAV